MNAKIVPKVRKSKHYNEKIYCKPTLFKIPLLLVRNLQQKRTYKHWQLKISIYSFLKYFRDSKITESDLLKRLPVFFENNFQTSRKSAVIQSVEYLIQEGFLMRDAQFIHIINFKNIVKEDYIKSKLPNNKKFLFKFQTNFFSFSTQSQFLEKFKETFISKDVLIKSQLELLSILDKKKHILKQDIYVALQASAEINPKISEEFLLSKKFSQFSAQTMINSLGLHISKNHLYKILSKGYKDESVEKMKTYKIIACSPEFHFQINKSKVFCDVSTATIIDDQQELLRFSHEMENKKSNNELDYPYFSLYGKNKSIRAICQVTAFYRKFNNISNQRIKIKLNNLQKEKIVKREILCKKDYEIYSEANSIQISPEIVKAKKQFSEEQIILFKEINAKYALLNNEKQNFEFNLSEKLNSFNESEKTGEVVDISFNDDFELTEFKNLVFNQLEKKPKVKTYFQQLAALDIHCNISEIESCGKGGLDCSDRTKSIEQAKSANGKDLFLQILKTSNYDGDKIILYSRLLEQEKRICKKLGLKIGEKSFNQLFFLNKENRFPLTEKQIFVIQKLKDKKVDNYFTKALANRAVIITTIA